HLDLKHLTRLRGQPSYVFVAIERATRFVHAEVITTRDAETVAACLERFLDAFGYPVHTILTDNGGEFTDRFASGQDRPPTGEHPVDKACAGRGIKHRLTRPFRPQTNGMVERFNRRIADAIRQHKAAARNGGKNKFDTHAERNAFIDRFVYNYNRTRLRCLAYKAPIETLLNHTGHNTCAGMTGKGGGRGRMAAGPGKGAHRRHSRERARISSASACRSAEQAATMAPLEARVRGLPRQSVISPPAPSTTGTRAQMSKPSRLGPQRQRSRRPAARAPKPRQPPS
ncbi:MAG: DDE-type integrase/transposase/recombinase, partial [Proteobacteria bacterium]|nr:DDE-type integrase/transposase/recombinase [Pseudomonadota bacterium]